MVQQTANDQTRDRVRSLLLVAALLLAPVTTSALPAASLEPASLLLAEEPPRTISLPGNVIGVAPHLVDLTPTRSTTSLGQPTSAAHPSIRRRFYRSYRALAASRTLKRLDPTLSRASQLPEASSSILFVTGLAVLLARRRHSSVPAAGD